MVASLFANPNPIFLLNNSINKSKNLAIETDETIFFWFIWHFDLSIEIIQNKETFLTF
jgi:hypothetical protein